MQKTTKISKAPYVAIKKPIVTIGMPVFNCEKYVAAAIESVLKQSYTNIILIISDNCSTDNTAQICKEYQLKDHRVIFYKQKKNMGMFWNYNFVLKKSTTEFFLWNCGDDLLHHNFISTTLKIYKKIPDLVCVMSDVQSIDRYDKDLDRYSLENIRLEKAESSWSQTRGEFFKNPTSAIYFCWFGLMKTKALQDISINYNGMVKRETASEIPLLAQLALKGKIISIPRVLKYYRVHDESIYMRQNRISTKIEKFKYLIIVSRILIDITYTSNLRFNEKIKLYLTTILTGLKLFKILFQPIIKYLKKYLSKQSEVTQ